MLESLVFLLFRYFYLFSYELDESLSAKINFLDNKLRKKDYGFKESTGSVARVS